MYDFQKVKEAILFNTQEVLPSDSKQLDQEIQNLIDLANNSGQKIRHYIGFEISGQLHFGNNTYQMLKIAKLQQAGIECIVWLADYHTFVNKKLDGKMETIHKVAKNYFEPVMRITLDNCGGDSSKLKFLYAFDEYRNYDQNNLSFWDYELECEEYITVSRILRSLSIAGKEGGESSSYKLTRYVGMQAADVFWLGTHLCQSGLDQRKIYVSCRDIAYSLDSKYQLKLGDAAVKPITMFNSLLLGMTPPEKPKDGKTMEAAKKMSKSNPDSAIFETDSHEEIFRKLKKAYCPMVDWSGTYNGINGLDLLAEIKETGDLMIQEKTKEYSKQHDKDMAYYTAKDWTINELTCKYSTFDQLYSLNKNTNPLLNWSEKLIYPAGRKIHIKNPKYNIDEVYNEYIDLCWDYLFGKIHPLDLKDAVARCLSDWFLPIRKWGEENTQTIDWVKSLRK